MLSYYFSLISDLEISSGEIHSWCTNLYLMIICENKNIVADVRRAKFLFTTYHLSSNNASSKDKNSILEASRWLFYFWIIFYDISVCESFVRSLFPAVHRAFKDASVSRYRSPRSIGVRGTYSLSSLRNVLGTSITFEVKMVNVLSRSSNVTFPRRVNCPFK